MEETVNKKIADKIDTFFAQYPQRAFDKGQLIIYSGSDPTGIFYLEKGRVRQYDVTINGDETVISVMKPPAFFPMMWALNKSPNSYFYEAYTPVVARIAPPHDVAQYLKENADVTYELLRTVYLGTITTQRRIVYLLGNSVRDRILYELLIECRRFGKEQPDGSFILDISESELARRTGLSRETISRQLSNDEIVHISRKNITIKNVKNLEDEISGEI